MTTCPRCCVLGGDEIDRLTHRGTYILRGLLRRAAAAAGAPIDSGEVLARRCVVASLSATRVVEVPFQSSCHGVVCPPGGDPALTSCVQGECVDPRCDIADERARRAFCEPDSFCATVADCVTASRCADVRCVVSSSGAGLCIVGDDVAGSCGAGEFCSRETGDCEPLPGLGSDAGELDALPGPDAGPSPFDLDAFVLEDAFLMDDARALDAAEPSDARVSTDVPSIDARGPDAPSALDAYVRPDAPAALDARVSPDARTSPDAGRDAWAADTYSMDACSATFANCDSTPGCETDLRTDANCGACGAACAMFESCSGAGECHCGTTYGAVGGGPACTRALPHATGRCQGSATRVCIVVTCDANWGNCDGMNFNGCETDLRATAAHCGACAAPCLTGETCSAGACRCLGGAACTTGQACRSCGCVPATETVCRILTGDEDCDGLTNCADPDCNGRICDGIGTMCVGGDCF